MADAGSVTRFSEVAVLRVPVARAWELLTDQDVLAAAIPGCDQIEPTGPGTGLFTVTPVLAAVSGTYSGDFTASGDPMSGSVVLTVRGAGDRGAFAIDFTLRLSGLDEETAELGYDVSGVFTGRIAGAGQRLLASITGRLAADFLAAIEAAATPPESARPESASARRLLVLPVRIRAVEPDDDDPISLARRPDVRLAFAVGVAIGLAGVVVATVLGHRYRQRHRIRTPIRSRW